MKSREHGRYEPTLVHLLAEQARSLGVNLRSAPGPWRAAQRRVVRRGGRRLDVLSVVTNDRTEVVVDTLERAADVAGLLNWCGVHELNPVPELTPGETESFIAEWVA